MLNKIGFWWIRLYYKLFKPNDLIEITFDNPNYLYPGDILITPSNKSGLLHLGKNYFILNKKNESFTNKKKNQ